MPVQTTVTIRRLHAPPTVEAVIGRRLQRLARYYPGILHARAVLEAASRHHRDGNPYHLRIELTLPGEDITIAHEPSLRPAARAAGARRQRKRDEPAPAHKLLDVAIRDAFAAARRRLQDYGRRQRGAVKQHPRSRPLAASRAPVA